MKTNREVSCKVSSGGTNQASRFTDHPSRPAFTLIELLVVIAVIAILAALVIPVSGAVRAAGTKRRAMAELSQVETLIDSYKEKLGHYPPDNPGNPLLNQLYYELMGTTNDTHNYTTLDGNASVPVSGVNALFGPRVSGFVNSSKGGGGDEGGAAIRFIKGLKPSQVGQPLPSKVVLLVSVPWQNGPPPYNVPPFATTNLNPWRYNSSNPTNNPNTYDLWLDVVIGGKPYRICNWNKQPLKL
jgi:prepilin-type N-terminal cleavage/methylation domain-containing protein